MNTKFRFVRCPRCLEVLPELAELPVYKCGGCGTVLQAKNRNNDTKERGPRNHETDPAQKNDLQHVSEDKEDSSLNQESTLPSTEESALVKSSEGGQNEFSDCRRERLDGVGNSDEIPSSTELSSHADELPSSIELSCHVNANSSPEAQAKMEPDDDKCPLDQYDKRDQNEFGDYTGERPGDLNSSKEVSSSTELNHLENESSSPLAGALKEEDESKDPLQQNNGMGENEFGDCSSEWPRNMRFSKESYSSSELTCNEIEELSPAAGSDTEMAENLNSRFIFRSSCPENQLDARLKDSSISAQRSVGECVLSENLMSPSNGQMKQAQNGILPCFERVSSVDTLENMPLVNSSSELGVARIEMYKSPTARSYYAYDGSESSCYEIDHKVPDQHLHLSKRNFKDAGFIGTKKLPKREELMVNNVMGSESEMKHRAMNSSSILPGKKQHVTKGSKWHQEELPEPTRNGHAVRNMMRLDTDEHLSRPTFYSRGSLAGPSSYGHNELQHRSSNHSPEKPEYCESDKVELLRMVYELQDQLNRTHISKEKINGRISSRVAKKEKQISSYHDHLAPEREMHNGRYARGKFCSPQCKFSRMAFSREAMHHRHLVDCSCLQCCPRDWHYSAQLPPHVICRNKGYYMAQPSHNCNIPYHSGPSSPAQYRGSDFSSWSRDTKSDDQRHKDFDLKRLNLRDKHQPTKRHFRPIAGGSPIIACYRCFELLQVPADFLLFRKKCHRLRCSACSEVLKFSLQNKIHVVRYIPDAIAPPPSEVDDHADATKKRNLASKASRASNHRNAEPVSYSEDYYQSFCKSGSTEGDPSSLTPFYALERNSNDRKMSSGSSFEPMEDKKKSSVFKESQNKYLNPAETFDSAGPSTKMSKWEKLSSEIEELTPGRSSPLHRLMGYSSPSKLTNR